ncbi:His/Gly/Thr/Pro-type tRNA ligase C-terminal domain-containing protein [Oceanimonas sp. NS1]|nr:His/Gly/Thr/Pro-type tRNA ligase C-terminal domain-containing protein [Oceanimonas sp. NS1]
MSHCGGGNFKKQLKRADKSGAVVALILGEDEVAQGQVTVKFLRGQAEQQTLAQSELVEHLEQKGI